MLARWGGNEFVILLPNVSLKNALILEKRIETCISENIFIDGYSITCGFGIAEMKTVSTFASLVREADALMYDAKQKRKDMAVNSR